MSSILEFHRDDRLAIWQCDSRVLSRMTKGTKWGEDPQFDAVVTDPPYELGFMGKEWDSTGIAYSVEFWEGILQAMKPGAHLVAFGHSRTYHRLACAIEDAGFELRDTLGWLYGSGFPKSLNVSKAVDSRRDWHALERIQAAVKASRLALGISQSEAARRAGIIGADEKLPGGGYIWFETGRRVPTREQWPGLKAALSLPDDLDEAFAEAEREVVGMHAPEKSSGGFPGKVFTSVDKRITEAKSELGKKWEGWGTALKPAWEPIVLARRPCGGSVASSVVKYGTGALNIDGCRVGDTEAGGRWPANILHDGSPEVLKVFPNEAGGQGRASGPTSTGPSANRRTMSAMNGRAEGQAAPFHNDFGSAARFFYTAKASAADRGDENGHPTVKPTDLMRYLCRLVTPPGGLVLDPFGGSGSTAVAALEEGFRCELWEQDAEFCRIARDRTANRTPGLAL